MGLSVFLLALVQAVEDGSLGVVAVEEPMVLRGAHQRGLVERTSHSWEEG